MSEKIIDGNAIAASIRGALKERIESMGRVPGLAVILVGGRRDSATYVRMKKKACAEVGIASFGIDYSPEVTENELLTKIDELNMNPDVHGILVQLPLPPHINEQTVIERVAVSKDVDGLHPLNVAKLASTNTHAAGRGHMTFDSINYHVACTPQGCIELLDHIGCTIESKRAVVLGRSNMVGIPVAMLLIQRNATVTVVHSKTVDIADVVKEADIVVAAVGRAELVKGHWLKPGAVVIDVGVNSVDDSSKKAGYRLVGDFPGGVGPMTIAMLLRNTVNSCARAMELEGTAVPPVPPTSSV